MVTDYYKDLNVGQMNQINKDLVNNTFFLLFFPNVFMSYHSILNLSTFLRKNKLLKKFSQRHFLISEKWAREINMLLSFSIVDMLHTSQVESILYDEYQYTHFRYLKVQCPH